MVAEGGGCIIFLSGKERSYQVERIMVALFDREALWVGERKRKWKEVGRTGGPGNKSGRGHRGVDGVGKEGLNVVSTDRRTATSGRRDSSLSSGNDREQSDEENRGLSRCGTFEPPSTGRK